MPVDLAALDHAHPVAGLHRRPQRRGDRPTEVHHARDVGAVDHQRLHDRVRREAVGGADRHRAGALDLTDLAGGRCTRARARPATRGGGASPAAAPHASPSDRPPPMPAPARTSASNATASACSACPARRLSSKIARSNGSSAAITAAVRSSGPVIVITPEPSARLVCRSDRCPYTCSAVACSCPRDAAAATTRAHSVRSPFTPETCATSTRCWAASPSPADAVATSSACTVDNAPARTAASTAGCASSARRRGRHRTRRPHRRPRHRRQPGVDIPERVVARPHARRHDASGRQQLPGRRESLELGEVLHQLAGRAAGHGLDVERGDQRTSVTHQRLHHGSTSRS